MPGGGRPFETGFIEMRIVMIQNISAGFQLLPGIELKYM
jgi:hypothetical protein